MSRQDEWDATDDDYRPSVVTDAGLGALRVALLFGSAAIALALIVVPIVDRGSSALGVQTAFGASGIDTMETGSIGPGHQYTIRRSVLQGSPSAICIINDNGTRAGDCN